MFENSFSNEFSKYHKSPWLLLTTLSEFVETEETHSKSITTISWSETVVQRCSVKKVFLKFFENSQQNTCGRVFFLNKVAGLRTPTFLKIETPTHVFP